MITQAGRKINNIKKAKILYKQIKKIKVNAFFSL